MREPLSIGQYSSPFTRRPTMKFKSSFVVRGLYHYVYYMFLIVCLIKICRPILMSVCSYVLLTITRPAVFIYPAALVVETGLFHKLEGSFCSSSTMFLSG